jgi:hypothetical protein
VVAVLLLLSLLIPTSSGSKPSDSDRAAPGGSPS